jgi:hypothetical protein
MDTISKNKRYYIKRLLDGDPSLVISELEGMKVIDLLKMIEKQKLSRVEVVAAADETDFIPRSLLSYCGIKN